jgi:molecular chaperone IbpA
MNEPFRFTTDNFNKYLVGFDKVLDTLSNVQDTYAKAAAQTWPPYNIVKVDENNYTIEMAVAGFGKHNIDIELANNTLIVKGGMTVDDMADATVNPVQYIWKGIADRVFTRRFTLADSVEVRNAEMINGVLKIFLENIIPEEKKPKKVNIR